MIKAIMYKVVCDNCRESWNDDKITPNDNIEYFNERVKSLGWLVRGRQHLCPECWSKGSNGKIYINTERRACIK